MDQPYIEVYAANGSLDAEIVKTFLESAGISTVIRQESVGLTFGLTVGSLGLAHIYVPADLENKARVLLAEMESGEFNRPGEIFDDDSGDFFADEE